MAGKKSSLNSVRKFCENETETVAQDFILKEYALDDVIKIIKFTEYITEKQQQEIKLAVLSKISADCQKIK
jgi:hypothetical protein